MEEEKKMKSNTKFTQFLILKCYYKVSNTKQDFAMRSFFINGASGEFKAFGSDGSANVLVAGTIDSKGVISLKLTCSKEAETQFDG